MTLLEAFSLAVAAGAIQGLVTWGAFRVELRWLRRDVDLAHRRIDRLHCASGRRSTDDEENCHA